MPPDACAHQRRAARRTPPDAGNDWPVSARPGLRTVERSAAWQDGNRNAPDRRKSAGSSGLAARVARRRRVQRCGELCHIAFKLRDLAGTPLVHFIDAQHGMQRQITAFDALEFGLDALLGRVENQAGALAKNQLLDLHETQHRAVADFASVDLVNLALVHEHDPEYVM